jgi:hypothetical protein
VIASTIAQGLMNERDSLLHSSWLLFWISVISVIRDQYRFSIIAIIGVYCLKFYAFNNMCRFPYCVRGV